MQSNSYIYPGRFQPFHNDHLAVVNHFFEIFPSEILTIGVVKNTGIYKSKSKLLKLSNENFESDRNLFSSEITLKYVSSISRLFPNNKLLFTLLPRPDIESNWSIIKSYFPNSITWVVHNRSEDWDLEKINYFRNKGENVFEFKSKRNHSGKDLRDKLRQKDSKELLKAMPKPVYNHIIQTNDI